MLGRVTAMLLPSDVSYVYRVTGEAALGLKWLACWLNLVVAAGVDIWSQTGTDRPNRGP